ncbi:DMP19 family protein [Fulvivirgaceae bacterium BMA12]|uniref:DMP19 family protein n=1 Tax=Agaribacillus aureus TaxID=3051825 RepID=A0ABT8L168_9BACT|nr:DMP19 family protein [Fulvivirgaceae bacterium BMA12]
MGLFKKNKQDSKFNLDKVLKMGDETSIIIAIDDYLNEKSDYCEDIKKLNKSQQTFIIIENLEREINNGGFNQFYFNSSGDFSQETVDALIEIGANKTADIVKKANSQFPDNEVPKDRDKRQDILEQIEDKADEIWETCDNDFYKYEDNIAGQLIEFVKANKTDFER